MNEIMWTHAATERQPRHHHADAIYIGKSSEITHTF